MLHRIREAMKTGTFEKLKDTVEVDETFVGGKSKQHAQGTSERRRSKAGARWARSRCSA